MSSNSEWKVSPEHVKSYLEGIDDIPHVSEGVETMLSEIPTGSKRILDLGCGDGRLLSAVLDHCPDATGVGLDFSPMMLEKASNRFERDVEKRKRVKIIDHDMEEPLFFAADSSLHTVSSFDCIISSFAIHHLEDERKRSIFDEIFSLLEPSGVFCNLEHVKSPSEAVHIRFAQMLGEDIAGDPSDKLVDVETQLRWLREIGFEDVDCYWKWREMALLVGRNPASKR